MNIAPPKRTLGIVMDPIASIKPYKDTTLALMLAAQQRGYALFYFEMQDLWPPDPPPPPRPHRVPALDRKSVVQGKGVYVRVDLGGRRIFKKKIYFTPDCCLFQ